MRQTREIGIRIALGARRSHVLWLVVGRAMSLMAIGCVIGLALAAAVSRVIASFLYGVPTTDPMIFASAATLFAIVDVLASYLPGRRALHISAIDALRCE